MTALTQYGLEQARKQLPSLVAQAHAGGSSIITRHGKPYAALVPIEGLRPPSDASNFLALRGAGRGLWGGDVGQAIADLRDEWGDA